MSIFLPTKQLTLVHRRRIDRIVCQMHADRARLLALEANAGYPARTVCPVRIVITQKQTSVFSQIWVHFRAVFVRAIGWFIR